MRLKLIRHQDGPWETFCKLYKIRIETLKTFSLTVRTIKVPIVCNLAESKHCANILALQIPYFPPFLPPAPLSLSPRDRIFGQSWPFGVCGSAVQFKKATSKLISQNKKPVYGPRKISNSLN